MIDIKVDTKTKIKDRGANNIFRQLEMMGNHTVITAGVQSPQGGMLPTYQGEVDGNTNIAEYAALNEYGTSKIPPRPFLRKTVADKKDLFLRQTVANMRKLPAGGSAAFFLQKQANSIAKWIKATIWTLRTPTNAPSTLRRKKRLKRGSNPLIFSGSMRDSITATVHMSKGPKDRKLRRIINKITKTAIRMKP